MTWSRGASCSSLLTPAARAALDQADGAGDARAHLEDDAGFQVLHRAVGVVAAVVGVDAHRIDRDAAAHVEAGFLVVLGEHRRRGQGADIGHVVERLHDRTGNSGYILAREHISETIPERLADGNFRIDNIPFHTYEAAFNDIVSATEQDGKLIFQDLIQPSGNTLLRIIALRPETVPELCQALTELGCQWETTGSLVAVNVPRDTAYAPILAFLKQGMDAERWGVEEAVLCHSDA